MIFSTIQNNCLNNSNKIEPKNNKCLQIVFYYKPPHFYSHTSHIFLLIHMVKKTFCPLSLRGTHLITWKHLKVIIWPTEQAEACTMWPSRSRCQDCNQSGYNYSKEHCKMLLFCSEIELNLCEETILLKLCGVPNTKFLSILLWQ